MTHSITVIVELDVTNHNRETALENAVQYVQSSLTEHSEPPEWLTVLSVKPLHQKIGRTAVNRVVQDPTVTTEPAFMVVYNDRVCAPQFNSRGAASAYLKMLDEGRRLPEYRSTKETSHDQA